MYGTGLYRHDSWPIGVGNRGTDAVTVLLAVPALDAALAAYRGRSVRGTVILVGVLGWLLYYFASMSLYTACNRVFGVYIIAFGLALFTAARGAAQHRPWPLRCRFPDPTVQAAADRLSRLIISPT